MKLTLYLLLGSAFILIRVSSPYSWPPAPRRPRPSLRARGRSLRSPVAVLGSPSFLPGLRRAGRDSPAVPHVVPRRPRGRTHGGLHAPRRRVDELGAYGLVRLGMGLLPAGTHEWMWLVGAIACINIVYGALSAMAQTDLKYVIAYSSVSHMGVVMLGAATLTETGLNGFVFQMFAHGVMTALFFAVGLVNQKAHSRDILKMGGSTRGLPQPLRLPVCPRSACPRRRYSSRSS